MRTSALLLLLLSLPALAQGRFDRFNARTPQGRSTRGFMDSGLLPRVWRRHLWGVQYDSSDRESWGKSHVHSRDRGRVLLQ